MAKSYRNEKRFFDNSDYEFNNSRESKPKKNIDKSRRKSYNKQYDEVSENILNMVPARFLNKL